MKAKSQSSATKRSAGVPWGAGAKSHVYPLCRIGPCEVGFAVSVGIG